MSSLNRLLDAQLNANLVFNIPDKKKRILIGVSELSFSKYSNIQQILEIFELVLQVYF